MTKNNFEIISCTQEYWEFVRKLRNNEKVSPGFIEDKYITKQDQQIYMKKIC